MDLRIRHATLEDLPWIVELYNSTIPGGLVTADTEPLTTEARLEWFQSHDPASRPLWIASLGDDRIAWVSFRSFYGRPAYRSTVEIALYIEEAWRGKGLGSQLLSAAIDACPELGISSLLGFIFAHNQPSLNLFRSLGFEQWGYLPRVAVISGLEHDLVITGKRIDKL